MTTEEGGRLRQRSPNREDSCPVQHPLRPQNWQFWNMGGGFIGLTLHLGVLTQNQGHLTWDPGTKPTRLGTDHNRVKTTTKRRHMRSAAKGEVG